MQVNVTAVSGPSATVSGVVEYGVAVSVAPMLTVSASIPGTQGDLDLDITPTPAETTDRLLVRRGGSAPFDLDLLSDLTPEQLVALAAEIAAARGDRAALTQRISTISNFASPNAGGIVVGQYYDNSFAAQSTTVTGATNRVEMAPFYTAERLRIDQIGATVTFGRPDALGRCFIYGSGADNFPDDLLFEGASDLDFSEAGYKAHSLDFTFDGGRQYWLGVRHNSNPTMRHVALSSSVNLGLESSSGFGYFTLLRRSLSFGTPLPENWSFQISDRVSASPPSIRMRAAAL